MQNGGQHADTVAVLDAGSDSKKNTNTLGGRRGGGERDGRNLYDIMYKNV